MARFTCNFISYTLMRAVDITVVIPSVTIPESMGAMLPSNAGAASVKPQHSKPDKFPVLYLLHGFGNNHATWAGYARVELFAEERNIAIVNISAENKFYVNQGADKFYDFIENELPDFVCAMFPISRRAEDTYVAGLSMGGFGALLHGFSEPAKYRALGAFSAAVSLEASDPVLAGVSSTPDPLSVAKVQLEAGKTLPKTYIACGKGDFLWNANVKFRDELLELGADLTWSEHPTYGHEWRFWDEQLEAFLTWLTDANVRSDAYAMTAKRQV